ncbi:MAG: IPT/TIG domain-containing protein [Verrucomicrobiota bacterium]
MHSPRRKNVVILVHGWNPGGQKNSYLDSGINERFGYLSNNLAVAVYDADWEVLQYHWEPDAATGPVIEGISDLNDLEKGFPNAIEAAEGAVQHGTHLGNILRDSDVESVHFICHSAGTWVARTAIAHLLQCSSKSAQITLLDPFVPGRETDTEISDSSLTEARIDEIDELSIDFPGRLVLLENYYAIDRWPIAGTNAGTDIYYFATSGEFDWRDDDVNRRIDFGLNYQSHSGPIEWYGDTVSDPVSDPEGINSDPGRGWLNSIYMQEPIIVSPPAWSSTLSGPSASVTATTRAIRDYNQENHLTYQWYRNGIEIDGEVGSSITISSPTAAKAGTYTVGVTNGELETMSGEAVLGVGDISGNFLIENVTNNPIPPTFFDQTITITGQGFTPSTTLLFHAPDGTPFPSVPAKLRYISEAELEYDINVYGDAGEWTVEAINGGFHSFPPYVFVASDQPTAPGSLVSIRVDGATSVEESGSADYRAYAHYTSGSPQPISPSWSVRGSAASIHSSSGVLSANAVGSDTSVDVVASFGGQEGTLRVEILDSSSGSGEVELIENGDFESGSQSWSLTGAEVTRGAYPYQGSRYLILGQTNNALDSASQTVTIPAHAASAELTYRLNVTSEHGTSSAEDLFFVVVREGGSDDFITGRSNIHQDDGPGRRYYRKYTHDLSDYIGDTVTIEFRVGTDEADSTAFRIDQVSLTAETPEEVRLVDLYINGPSVVDEDTTTNFDAVAVYSDGSTEVRSADWSENSRKASFSGDDFRAFNVDQDEDVRITAERTEGGVTRSATKTVTIREAHVVQYFTLNINAINGRVSRSPNSSSYAAGTEVTLTAIPNSGYEFSQWAGDTSGTAERKKIIIDGNKSITASFDPLPPLTGSLVVGLFPEAVIPSGAQWRLNGGAWQNPGVTMTAIPVGNHTVEFSPVSGWLTPAAVTITINEGQTARVDGTYTFNENSPLIFSVSPSQGPIDGNTLVTIRGANLADVVEVRFGGVPATSLEIITEGEIRLTTPPATAFGTVSVAVETGDETQTDPNGFNYAAPMGWNMELLAQLGGSVLAADVEGTMACFTHGARFKVMDLTNFSSPQVLGEVTLPDEGRYIEIENDLAFVASPFAGISVVDLSNPSEPVLIGSYDTEGQPTGMKVEDSLLYVCDGENGLLIFDVTAPSSPQLIGQLETSRHLTTVELTTGPGGEKLAIAAHYSGGIDVIDVTNPTAPFLTGSLTTPSGKAFNLRVQGSAAYLAVDSQGGLYAVNLSDPANPTLAKQINSPSFDAIEINGDYIYAGSRDWFRIFDISNPLDPTPAGSITMPDEINFRSFSRSGNRMVAAAHGGGFRVFDVSTASQPRLEGAFQPPIARGEDLVIDETHAYVSTREGFEVVDISSPGSPARVSGISMTNIEGRNPDELTKEGDIIYLSGSSKQVEGFDVSNPASPIRGDYYFNDLSALCVAAEGNLMFQGGFHQTLSGPHLGIIDVSNLNNFSFRSFVPFNLTSGSVRGVDVHGGIGYAAVSNYGLKIFDYSNPDAPTDLGGFPIGVSRFNNLRVVNQVAYLCE